MNWRTFRLAMVVLNALSVAACARNGAPHQVGEASAAAVVASRANAGAFSARRPAELEDAATEIIAFLRRETGFDRLRLADTVTLYLSPEGGGTRARIAREQLRDRSSWRVRGRGRATYSLVPPEEVTKLTTRVGRHFNCREYALSSRFPELAQLPHVGTKLEPADASSCLQTWNLTLVFDPNRQPPTLVAAVYDQWEW